MTPPLPQTARKRRRQIKWTDELVQQLLRLHRAGLSHRAIAKQMNLRHDQIEGKCHRLGLSRANPGRPNPKLAKVRAQSRVYRESKPPMKLDVAERQCLNYKREFRSEHKGNRICKRCLSLDEFQSASIG